MPKVELEIITCDRCGEEIKGSRYSVVYKKFVYARMGLFGIVRGNWKFETKDETKAYLCEDCTNSFYEWLETPWEKNQDWS